MQKSQAGSRQAHGRFCDHGVRVLQYFRDRTLRIYPTYLLVITTAAPAYFLWSEQGSRIDWSQPANVLCNLLPTTVNLWERGFDFMVSPVAWSLGSELVFYAVAPLLFFLLRTRWIILIGAALVAADPLLQQRSLLTNDVDPLFNLKSGRPIRLSGPVQAAPGVNA